MRTKEYSLGFTHTHGPPNPEEKKRHSDDLQKEKKLTSRGFCHVSRLK